ncbi:unnamed protein product, partial [Ectocarpus sp. 12 AP-2014]
VAVRFFEGFPPTRKFSCRSHLSATIFSYILGTLMLVPLCSKQPLCPKSNLEHRMISSTWCPHPLVSCRDFNVRISSERDKLAISYATDYHRWFSCLCFLFFCCFPGGFQV